jgi:hypothetical protein
VADPPPGDRGHLEDLLGQVGEGFDAAEQHVGEGVGQGHLPAGRAGGDQRLGEEGVAFGAGQDAVDRRGRHHLAGQRLQVLGQLGAGERRHLDALQVRDAQQLGQERPQRVAAVQVVRAVAGDQGDAAAAQGADQERDQVAGGAVGPVQVLDDQQQRGQLGQAGQQRQDAVEQLHPLEPVARRCRRGGGVPGAWQQQAETRHGRRQPVGQLRLAWPGAEVAEGVHKRHVRQAEVADLHAAADQHPHALRFGAGGELAEQAGLAHAGVAGHQRHRRAALPGPGEHAEQPAELGGAAHEHRAARGCHARQYAGDGDSRERRRAGLQGPARRCRAVQAVCAWRPARRAALR